MEKTGKLINYVVSLKLNENVSSLLLWGMKITSTFVAISSSETMKINKTGPSWTCSLWG